jgi:MFS family permease
VTYIMFIFLSPILPLIMLGFTYSIFASVVWPSLSLVVPKEIIGIAFGVATSLQNLGLVFFPLIIAFIFTNTQSYDITLLFFIFLLIMALVLAMIIELENKKHENILNLVVQEKGITANPNENSYIKNDKKDKSKNTFLQPCDKTEEEIRLYKIKELF